MGQKAPPHKAEKVTPIHVPVSLRDRAKIAAPLVGKKLGELAAEALEKVVSDIEKRYLKKGAGN